MFDKYVHCYLFCIFKVLSAANRKASLFVKESNEVMWDSYENTDDSFTIKTNGCSIPGLNFLDPSIRHLINYPTNVTKCPNEEHPLVRSNKTHIWIVKENLPYHNITHEKYFQCCYKYFYPMISTVSGGLLKPRHNGVRYLFCVKFNNYVEVNTYEFVRVNCKYYVNMVYDQFFAFTPKKRFTSQRENPFEFPQDETAYNVIIMGLESVSRLNFHRTMPHTLNLLKKKGVIEMLGYSKVVDSVSNFIPTFTGMGYKELKDTCWPHPDKKFDRCPFIWERFKDIGYYTAFIEDAARFATNNPKSLDMSAFDYVPTDYYLQPFIRETKEIKSNLAKLPVLCMGDKYYYQVILDYIESLTTTLKSYKLFGLLWESFMSNKHLNYPMLMDHDYAATIKRLDDSGYLDDTILILLSDQGIKTGDIMKTTQGRLEERLPFLYILVPPSFKQKYSFAYQNLKRNALRLTTPFDFHATLIDLVELSAVKNEELLARSKKSYAAYKGISLFLGIPTNRTCESAGINSTLCTCLKSRDIHVHGILARQASLFLMHYLNSFLSSYPQCERLAIEHIIEMTEVLNIYENVTQWRDFMIKVRMMPGGGLFEAMLRFDDRKKIKWEVLRTVSRLNHYVDAETDCVQDYQLKLYCHCRSSNR